MVLLNDRNFIRIIRSNKNQQKIKVLFDKSNRISNSQRLEISGKVSAVCRKQNRKLHNLHATLKLLIIAILRLIAF